MSFPKFSARGNPSGHWHTQRRFGLPSAQYSNPSFALPSDGFRPYVRTHICSFLLMIDNYWQMKLVITDKQR